MGYYEEEIESLQERTTELERKVRRFEEKNREPKKVEESEKDYEKLYDIEYVTVGLREEDGLSKRLIEAILVRMDVDYDLKIMHTPETARNAVRDGEIDIVTGLKRGVYDEILDYSYEYQYNSDYDFYYAYAVAENNKELVSLINDGLKKLSNDGTYDQIYSDGFPTDQHKKDW